MNGIDALTATTAGATVADDLAISKRPTDAQIQSAAQQFEGLLIHQMLKSVSGENGWLGAGEGDAAGLQAMDLAQEQFAAALSQRGGLGLAQMVGKQLSAESASTK
jgi:Rod binding domain-containing protein